MKKLKAKWGIQSNIQFVTILVVFSLAGSLTVFVRRPLFEILNFNADTSLWIKTLVYIIAIPPVHFALLMIIGSLLGQYKFFYEFQSRIVKRFKGKKA